MEAAHMEEENKEGIGEGHGISTYSEENRASLTEIPTGELTEDRDLATISNDTTSLKETRESDSIDKSPKSEPNDNLTSDLHPQASQDRDGKVSCASPSPKMTRPKLPVFTGNGKLVGNGGYMHVGHGGHRAKTDPGRGGEIKAIIDQTMEDIRELNKVDFAMFSRPKKFPKPLQNRSQSTHVSPRSSPTPGSPSKEENPALNRSRSLKLLTDMLKSGRGGAQHGEHRSENIPLGEEGGSDVHLGGQGVIESESRDGELRSSSDGQLEDSKPASYDESLMSRSQDSGSLGSGKKEKKKSHDKHHRPRFGVSGKNRENAEGFRRAKSEIRKIQVSDDEGLDVTSDHEGHSASKPYHSIDTNSQFFTLYKTGPAKRRPGFAGLTHHRFMSGPDDGGGREGEPGIKRFNRVELKPISAKNRFQSLRHITHPPQSQPAFREGGTMDSNGFGSVLKSPSTESPPPFPPSEDMEKTSDFSLTDSQAGQSDSFDDASYVDLDENLMTRSCDSIELEKPERKNSKGAKPKSRSDPSAQKASERDVETPQIIGSCHSSPILSKGSENDDEDEEAQDTAIEMELDEMSAKRKISGCKRPLARAGSLDEGTPLQFDPEMTGSRSYSLDEEGSLSPGSDPTSGPSPSHYVSTLTFCGVSAPSTPMSQSPTGTLDRSQYLDVPAGTAKKSIGRSASSASMLQRERKFSGNAKEKDMMRKHSMTGGEDTNLLLPLSDSHHCHQGGSMPSVLPAWKRDRDNSMSPDRDPSFIKDKRCHIVEEFYRNEKEYVDALRTLKDKYMTPLKTSSSIDETIVDNIFYMIPEILTHHQIYLNFLESVWQKWDSKLSTIGNIIVGIFSKQTVIDSYFSFVENYRASGKVIENALQTKSSVQKFLEQCQRESGSKLSMKDLIVRPIQRIPRYELLIQRLIENTPIDHPDYLLLKEAEKVMHNFAIRLGSVNENQTEEDQQDTLKQIEQLLMTELVAPERQYIRHDMVTIMSKKDQCCIWIFSDLVIFSSIKRRTGQTTRKVSVILKTASGQDFAENIKHKVWLRVGFNNVEIVKSQTPPAKKSPYEPDQLEEDITHLNTMKDLTAKMNTPHSSLETMVKEMLSSLNKQLSELNLRNASMDSNKLELLVTTQEGVYPLEVCFSTAEKKATWETTFLDAKLKLSILSDKRAPEFQQPLQITKTRAGMQFSCAAPIDGLNASGHRDVWVCNSDGYVGHMCLLSLQPEPIVTLNTPVPGCNARILCICAIPAYCGTFRRKSSCKQRHHGSRPPSKVPSVSEDGPQINIEEVEDNNTEEDENTSGGYQTDSESSDEAEAEEEEAREASGDNQDDTIEEETVTEVVDDNDEDEVISDPVAESKTPQEEVPCEEERRPEASSQGSPLVATDSFTTTGHWRQDAFKSTMWLGTEDGCIHIFQCTDNIKTTKNKLKIHHGSPVYCIVYLDNKVFVSLANGDLIVYRRDTEGLWDTENPYTRTVGSVTSPISKMLAVAGKLWCGCQNQMNIINPLTLSSETTFQVTSDPNKCVQCLVCSGQGVWLAPQQSSKVLLYHATTFEFLLEVSIASAVAQKLQSADDIIRQHKAACLRITALLVCKDLLWVGTSAGVILTIPTPRITSTTTRGTIPTPSVTGLVYGHTGHVRFLTCVELTAPQSPTTNRSSCHEDSVDAENHHVHDHPRRASMVTNTATLATRMLIISGGDGYEDFRNNSSNEVAGRDDSTNHLLLWQV